MKFEYTLSRRPYTGDYLLRIQADGAWHPVARFGMLPMSGNNKICVLHHSEVEPKLRGYGIGLELLKVRLKAAKQIGYKAVMCTVRSDNAVELNLLAKNGVSLLTYYEKQPGVSVYLGWKIL